MGPRAVPFTILLVLVGSSGCLGGGPRSIDSPPPLSGHAGSNATLRVDFDFVPRNPAVGQPVQFEDLSSDEEFEIASYAWDFGDGHGSTEAEPSHSYSAAGAYTIILRVKNAADVQANASHLIPVHTVTGKDLPPPVIGEGSYLQFGSPVTVQSGGGGEPSIAIDGDGRIFVNPIRRLYRSSDDGKTFEQLSYPGITSGDSHITVDRDDRLWASDLGGFTLPLFGSVSVWTSEDHGASFAKGNPAASDTVLNDRQWLAASGGGKGFLLYRSCTVFVPPGSCFSAGSLMTRTVDGGLTWMPVGRTFEWTSFPFVDHAQGTLYVVQANGAAIDVAVSGDDGVSFLQTRVAQRRTPVDNIFVNGAVDDAGNAYVAWVDKDSQQYDVWMAYTTNKGGSWSKPFRVSSGIGTAVFPWVAAGGDGRVAVAWYGTTAVAEPGQAPTTATWSVYAAYSNSSHEKTPVFTQSRATDSVHQGAICTGGTGCGEADRDLLDFMMVAIMPDGRVALVYGQDDAGSNTKTQFLLQDGGPLAR